MIASIFDWPPFQATSTEGAGKSNQIDRERERLIITSPQQLWHTLVHPHMKTTGQIGRGLLEHILFRSAQHMRHSGTYCTTLHWHNKGENSNHNYARMYTRMHTYTYTRTHMHAHTHLLVSLHFSHISCQLPILLTELINQLRLCFRLLYTQNTVHTHNEQYTFAYANMYA